MHKTRLTLLLSIAALWLAADQLTKHFALSALEDNPRHIVGFLWLRLARNSGSAFGIASNYGVWIGLVGVAILASFFLVVRQLQGRASVVFVALIMGGAVGNLGDRIFRADDGFMSGKVVDFIDLTWWPIFNLADTGIVVGLFGTAILFFLSHRREEMAGAAADETTGTGTAGTGTTTDETADDE